VLRDGTDAASRAMFENQTRYLLGAFYQFRYLRFVGNGYPVHSCLHFIAWTAITPVTSLQKKHCDKERECKKFLPVLHEKKVKTMSVKLSFGPNDLEYTNDYSLKMLYKRANQTKFCCKDNT
jgi:hypothetical protein